ncbi:divergent polysaccharide deacetylase family protein [Photorhabdus heterorhabditis]|uniref:divergent polysaccharide deacetylase family protein n=1 Tax=Photorhabdus heterorhabditis TaxID=880156 RepID=UPI0015621BA5|nr:divergent polysaccharide deacetylase family protein [Photorhabdus heterorhabditis]NRN29542.1 divergent polysaccharide deacetylase family protein [Photorhabdus heterorhabditis subsp. aluminescens]
MRQLWFTKFIAIALLFLSLQANASRLAIVIDDFGYRPHNESKILQMPVAISIAILPDSPHGREMAEKAHKQRREILIHLPMAPLSKQLLEPDTLQPTMSSEEIDRIIQRAIQKVPYAVGMNNHMGSAMTSSLPGMQKVMHSLSRSHLYFLDSVTIGNTQATKAAKGTPVRVIRRNVFLDDVQSEAETRYQLNRAISIARKNGSAIAIGHPHPTTIRALQKMLPTLPADIELVSPSMLLSGTPAGGNQHKWGKQCEIKAVSDTVTSKDYLAIIGDTLVDNPIVNTVNQYIQKLTGDKSQDKAK